MVGSLPANAGNMGSVSGPGSSYMPWSNMHQNYGSLGA